MKIKYLLLNITRLFVLLLLCISIAEAKPPKNVILMISDGCGFNAFASASMYQGKLGKEIYNDSGWVHYAVATYPLNMSSTPLNTNMQSSGLIYDPIKAWSKELASSENKSDQFLSYQFLKTTATDSAAAGTAISSGVKTYNNAINWSDLGKPTITVHERMKVLGKATGVVTTVPWSHATPATMVAHNVSRNNYSAIANEMLESSMDVIFGAGNPDFNDDGKPDSKDANYVGGKETWEKLKNNQYSSRQSIQTLAQFKELTKGNPKGKFVGTAQAYSTLQQNRSGYSAEDVPFSDPLNKNVPSLKLMTSAALNILDSNPNGFFLMIEGGAVDWANHANQHSRMIEEQIDFMEALSAVNQWVSKNSSWEETVVIVTADHETGMLWGPMSNLVAFDPIVNQGKNKMPLVKYNSGGHTNSLVPLWAKGANVQQYQTAVKGTDPVYGKWIENTSVLTAIEE